MLAEFFSRLFTPDQGPLDQKAEALALAALMVRIAQSDHFQAAEEMERIEKVLVTRYELTDFAAQSLRIEAEKVEAEAPDTVRFTRALKEAVALEDRIGLIVALWEVALADGARGAEEDQLIRQVVALLGVSDVDSARARQMAGMA